MCAEALGQHFGIRAGTLGDYPNTAVAPLLRCYSFGSIEHRAILLVFSVATSHDELQRANWKLGGPRGAAVRLGLKRTTLFYKMKRLGIAPPADHSQD